MSRRIFFISSLAVLMAVLISTGCVHRRPEKKIGEIHTRSIEQAFDAQRDALLSTPGVVGAGIAKLDEKPCIVVMVIEKYPDLENHVPKELDGYAVIIEIVGDFKIQERD